ncbi:WD-repeat protein, putative [Ixodes scapularis]|uniref:WD-repeat protein, putative n=1 Tax=Ixodes scapularis TaxID=6945 RepID=B7P3S6_IXOSC|nr:WD-repeat protein, putative [Ixodes scapularis]|eukprot:XP_002404597.1 WD-repeat protein, putative [Ixodes scapularis]
MAKSMSSNKEGILCGCLAEPGCPVLAIGYESGKVQLMCSESDDSPLILDTDMTATCLQWNHDGTMLAVTGKHYAGDTEKRNMVKFFNPYGQHLHTLRVPGRDISACAWEGTGLRIALAVDSFIFFANIRPDYKWCFLANTIAYSFSKVDRVESTVIFWNINSNEKHVKYMKNLLRMGSAGELCVIAAKEEGPNPQYTLSVCNSIGTPVDSTTTEVEPRHLYMTESYVLVASADQVFVWRFQTPRGRTVLELSAQRSKPTLERVFHVNDMSLGGEGPLDPDKIYEPNSDPICCLTASEKMLIVGRESGTFQRYSMPHLAMVQKYVLSCRPTKIALNCNSSRMSVIDITGNMLLHDLEARSSQGEQLAFERRDVWDVKWAKDNSELFALMEKTRMYVFRNLDPENEDIRKAEVKAYFKQFDDAEKIYLDIDRRDSAVTYYKQGHNHGRLAEAYYTIEDYDSLESLMKSLPEGQPLLADIGSMFGSVGMCSQAVEAFKKCNKVKAAIDICVSLNEWNDAIELAKEFNIREIDTVLARYAKHLLDEKKVLSAVELYRKANRFLDAAQLMFKVSEEYKKNHHTPLTMKKIYVLAATLVEEHRTLARRASRSVSSIKAANEVSQVAFFLDKAPTLNTSRPMDQPWRGAEAFHFYILAQRQLYEGFMDAAMRTALNLRDYEDILDVSEIYTLLALTSCANRSFGTCSKAFVKLESLETLSLDQRQAFEKLAVDIFTKYSRKDARDVKMECPSCESAVTEWSLACPSCGGKLPLCVATGRILGDPDQQWTCSFCKHGADKHDMFARHTCPLCHRAKTSAE